MSEDPGMTMEEAEETEENELLCGEEEDPDDVSATDNIEEMAEDLMTDMKLEDEIDELRMTEPDFQWSYHIEIYPWSADDMSENFVRLLKLADFSQIFMRKKGVCKENGEPESVDDKLLGRQRKGSIHFYTDNFQNAKTIIRSSTWKAMASKQLTFEITRRVPDSSVVESAYLEVDTYTACKCRYRDKPKGEFKDRTARISCIPDTISLEFLDVVFCRAHAVTGGSSVKDYYKERDGKQQQKLSQMKDFDGSLDFDCLSRGSCRSFVTAHKNVYIEGQRISIVANNKDTMVAPPPAPTVVPSAVNYAAIIGKRKLVEPVTAEVLPVITKMDTKPQAEPSQGALGHQVVVRGGGPAQTFQGGRGGLLREPTGLMVSGRGRGMGRSTLLTQRPVSSTLARLPVPMTGRQKMNEKMRRSNLGLLPGPPVSNSIFMSQGGPMVPRNAMTASIGESFKQEIAALQKQLQQNTAELEAKIAMLRESTSSGAFFDENDGDWGETAFGDEEDYPQDNFLGCGDMPYVNSEVSGNYQYSFEDIAYQRGMVISDNMIVPDATGQGKSITPSMATHRGLHVGSSTTAHGAMAGPGISHADMGQMPVSFTGQLPHSSVRPMLQTRPGQMFQQFTSQVPQTGPGQMPHQFTSQAPQTLLGQMPHQFPGQVPQMMPGQMPQAAPGQLVQSQMAQTMPGELTQVNPSQMFKPLSGHMVQPGNGPIGSPAPSGLMQGPPQRGGGTSFQRLKGSFRGRGKPRGGMSGTGGW